MDVAAPKILPLSAADAPAVEDLLQWAFGFTVVDAGEWSPFDSISWERTFGAWLDDPWRLAGVNTTHSFDVPVPGATLPAAGVSWVGVHPRDRRRGVATAMLRHHLHEVHDRGVEPLSLLFASEAGIYGRYGYGMAATELQLALGRGVGLRDVAGTEGLTVSFERADAERHAELLYECYTVARVGRPGWVDRPTTGLRREVLADPRWRHRLGGEVLRLLTVAGEGGRIRGYALFRRWSGGPNAGTVEVVEAVAVDLAAYRVLWGRLVDLDLTSRITTPRLATDDPLLHLLLDVPAAEPKLGHNLWCRVVDVPAALAGRRYAAPVEAVLDVTDPMCPWNQGRWRLVGGPDGASCESTDDAPQLRLDVRELGAVYLGGQALHALAGAGLVEVGDEGALAGISTAFGWPRAPLCPAVF
ncbi:MAG: GNAT family N-acetyltransferase [Actinomycetales bacterium]|nr:GNAT family N-acetyltransferase [Actinomycetales bacterium]